MSATNHHTGLHAVSQSATVEVEDKYNTAAMLMTRVAFLGTVATALRAGSARRAPFWRRSQTTMSFSIQDTVAASDVVVELAKVFKRLKIVRGSGRANTPSGVTGRLKFKGDQTAVTITPTGILKFHAKASEEVIRAVATRITKAMNRHK